MKKNLNVVQTFNWFKSVHHNPLKCELIGLFFKWPSNKVSKSSPKVADYWGYFENRHSSSKNNETSFGVNV